MYEGEGKVVSWEQLSTEQKQAVDLDRIANERLEQVLGAAVGDAAELRQVITGTDDIVQQSLMSSVLGWVFMTKAARLLLRWFIRVQGIIPCIVVSDFGKIFAGGKEPEEERWPSERWRNHYP